MGSTPRTSILNKIPGQLCSIWICTSTNPLKKDLYPSLPARCSHARPDIESSYLKPARHPDAWYSPDWNCIYLLVSFRTAAAKLKRSARNPDSSTLASNPSHLRNAWRHPSRFWCTLDEHGFVVHYGETKPANDGKSDRPAWAGA